MTTGLTKPLAGVGEDGRHLYTCPLCEAMCGLEIHVEDGRELTMSPAIAALVNGVSSSPWINGLMSRTHMYFGPACCPASSPNPGPGVCSLRP